MPWSFPAARGWPQPDFLPRPARPPWLAWAALLCASAVLALAVDEWIALDAAREQLHARIARLPERPVAEARSGPPVAPPGAAEAAQGLANALAHPWEQLFESSERHAANGVRWLRLDHDAGRGSVRLDGVAPDRRAVLATLESLAADSNWSDVLLLRIEAAVPDDPGERMVRFELRGRLGGASRESR